jgi:hypothetical protein
LKALQVLRGFIERIRKAWWIGEDGGEEWNAKVQQMGNDFKTRKWMVILTKDMK